MTVRPPAATGPGPWCCVRCYRRPLVQTPEQHAASHRGADIRIANVAARRKADLWKDAA